MDSSSIATRLKTIIQYLGLSDSQFADKCEISRATLSLLLSGKNKKISDVLLSQIHSTFPEISIIWLLFDEGEMVSSQREENESIFSQDESFENKVLPSNDTDSSEYSNLIPLNSLESFIKSSVTKALDSFLNSSVLLNKFSKEDIKRKVRQITVYYDDSTFETFMPG